MRASDLCRRVARIEGPAPSPRTVLVRECAESHASDLAGIAETIEAHPLLATVRRNDPDASTPELQFDVLLALRNAAAPVSFLGGGPALPPDVAERVAALDVAIMATPSPRRCFL